MNNETQSSPTGNKPAIAAVIIFALMSVLAFWIHAATVNFEHVYRDYAVQAAEMDAVAYIPGAGNNPVRIEMNNTLIQILGNNKISPQERLALARRGIELVSDLDVQTNAITQSMEKADSASQELNVSAGLISNLFSKGLPNRITALAQERREAVSDIRAYSFRANSETKKILEHIVRENGSLSNQYILELNNLIPAQEEEFNLRTNRYADLQRIGEGIDNAFEEFIERFGRRQS